MAMTLTGFVFDSSGNAVSGATVQGYVSADNATTTAESATTTDSNGKWSITTSTAARIPMDVKITFGSSVRWLKAGDSINVSKLTLTDTLTVGEDDVGFDVTFHGASAGAAVIYDASEDTLEVRGPSADATTSTGKLLLTTALTDVNANDVIGDITFKAPLEAGGTDAITAAASIKAIAQGTFSASVNATDLIFFTGHSEAATEKFRFTSQGELGIGGATYGSSGDVLTSGGAGAAPTWETPTTGDITAVTLTADDSNVATDSAGSADFTIAGGAGLASTVSGTTVTLAGTDASTSAKGIAQFSSDNFAASSGTITIKDGGVVTAEIAADAITSAKIAADAVTGDHIASDAIVTASITDANVTLAKIANAAANTVIVRDANDSGVLSAKAVTNTQILIGDGTGFTAAALSGDATMANDGTVAIGSGVIVDADVNASAAIAISKTALVAGTNISLSTNTLNVDDAFLKNDANDTTSGIITAGGVVLSEAAHLNIGTPLLGSTDHTFTGTTAQMLAGAAVSAFNLVCIHSTTQEIIPADASAYATSRAIGIAPAAISDTATGTVLLHGFVRDDSYNFTTGATLYLSETAGALTETAPTTDGAFVQAVGIALSPDVVYINPSMDVIEHA